MKTIVLGASPNPERFSYRAVSLLISYEHEVVPLGIRKGEIAGNEIITDFPQIENVHTITLYLGAKNQVKYYDYILNLRPQRIIFNPGTENPELKTLARENNIEVIERCSLVMLNSGHY